MGYEFSFSVVYESTASSDLQLSMLSEQALVNAAIEEMESTIVSLRYCGPFSANIVAKLEADRTYLIELSKRLTNIAGTLKEVRNALDGRIKDAQKELREIEARRRQLEDRYALGQRVSEDHGKPKGPAPRIRIENVVTVVTGIQQIDLKKIAPRYPNAVYRPEEFPALLFRAKYPETQSLIFRGGEIVTTGAGSLKEAQVVIKRLLAILEKEGYDTSRSRSRVGNIVATASLSGQVNLDKVVRELKTCMFDPTLFPGLIFKTKSGIVILLLSNGTMVVTGATQEDEIEKAIVGLQVELERYGLITYSKQ